MEKSSYAKLGLMLLFSFIIMYSVMFLNVDSASHIYLSMTRLYMSLLMVAPMSIIMLLFMRKMYSNRQKNAAILLTGVTVVILSILFLRKQVFVNDSQYMQAMIPHHSSAIMTSKNALIVDPELKKLSESIIESQEREIQQMKDILKRLKQSE